MTTSAINPELAPRLPGEQASAASWQEFGITSHLRGLPHEGFGSEALRTEVMGQIGAIGLQVEPFNSIRFAVGSEISTTSAESQPQLVIHEQPGQPQEARLNSLVRQLAEANSPFRPETAERYGSDEARLEAVTFARDAAQQSLDTGLYLTGEHKHLAKQRKAGIITRDEFASATHRIAATLAMTNRAKLMKVEADQEARLNDPRARGSVAADTKLVRLFSETDDQGRGTVAGIDKSLIALTGASGQAELMTRIRGLKAKFYSPENAARADERYQRQNSFGSLRNWGAIHAMQIAHQQEQLRQQQAAQTAQATKTELAAKAETKKLENKRKKLEQKRREEAKKAEAEAKRKAQRHLGNLVLKSVIPDQRKTTRHQGVLASSK